MFYLQILFISRHLISLRDDYRDARDTSVYRHRRLSITDHDFVVEILL